MMASRYHANISINYLFSAFINLNIVRGLWMIYLASQGYSLFQLGILEGIFHVTSFLMEVPTGVVADLLGRKTSRTAGRVISCLGIIPLYFAWNFPWLIIGFMASALSYNLESGAGDALVYDSLVADGKEALYMRIVGRQELIAQCSAILAYLIGGYLAIHSYGMVYGLSFLISLCAVATSLFFTEPPLETTREAQEKPHPRSTIAVLMREQTIESVKVILERPRIAFLIMFSELLFAFIICMFFYLQNYWTQKGSSQFQIGAVFAAGAFVSGLTSFACVSIEHRIGEKGVLVLMPTILMLCLWGVSVSPFPAVFYVLMGSVEGILVAAVGTYLNRLIPSRYRATILSFQSMAYSLFMILLFPIVGWVGDHYTLQTAFIAMAVLGTVICIPYLALAKSFFNHH